MSGLPYRYGSGVMTPMRPKLCAEQFEEGGVYFLESQAIRSEASHRHQFAWLREAWTQLPEDFAEQFPSPEHLRKAALIQAGYFNETIIDVGDLAGAARVAAYLRHQDEFSHVVERRNVVVVRVAKSQSRRSMNPRDFQDSKQKVLEIVAQMIGVAPEALERNSGQAA